MLALAYMAWRSAQVTAQNSHVEPQAPPQLRSLRPRRRFSRARRDVDVETRLTRHAANQQAVDPPQPVRNNPVRRDEDDEPTATNQRPPHRPLLRLTRRSHRRAAPAGNGAEELAIAQRYLNGANGQQRNRAEAAKWLWKSIAKHNADATLLLADLYLKGDGVSKNCDQARVLLDSAARNGIKEAGERLRHLQAFGCQ